jgi:hypothetical protein
MPEGRIEIRSYRAVFDLERRLYRIDRYRLNPSGVPVRGVVYVLAAVLAVLVGQRVPLLGSALAALPWQARYVALPCLWGVLLTIVRIDGRPGHAALAGVLRYALAPRFTSAFAPCPRPGGRWTPPRLASLVDGSGGGRVRLRFRGPGAVRVAAAHRVEQRGSRLRLTVAGGPAGDVPTRAIVVRQGATLHVRRG